MSKIRNVEDVYPLTPTQMGMLFHTLQEPNAGMYIVQVRFELRGQLDLAVFRKAWDLVVSRHTILRTLFAWEGLKEPLQVVRQTIELPIKILDWLQDPTDKLQENLDELANDLRNRPVDLGKAPVFDLTLIRLDSKKAHLIWQSHHILMDGWSFTTIIAEVIQAYEDLAQGKEPQLPKPVPFKTHLDWLQKQDREKAKEYWRKHLMGFNQPTLIPTDITEAHGQTKHGKVTRDLSVDISKDIKEFAKNARITLNTLFLGAWSICLGMYCRSQEVVFGSTIAGRSEEMLNECTAGMFINTLPLRVPLTEERTLINWLKDIQQQQLLLQEYKYSALNELQSWSQLDNNVSLFETVVVFENYPVSGFSRGTSLEWISQEITEQTNYPFVLEIAPTEEIHLQVLYQKNIYREQTISQVLDHLVTILQNMVSHADSQLKEVPLISDEELKRIGGWNQTELPLTDKSLLEQFSRTAKDRANQTALIFEGEEMTYDELYRRSLMLSKHLKDLGLGEGQAVGIAIPRSPNTIIAILATVMSGGVYVPLDPDYPVLRLEYMVKDSRMQLVLTEREVLKEMPAISELRLNLDEFDFNPIQGDLNEQSFPKAQNLYITYTSGSTGKPKGVLGTQKGLLNRLQWQWNNYPVEENEIFCQKTTLNFVDHLWEIWGALLSGAKLLIVPDVVIRDGAEFLEILAQPQIRRVVLVPSFFKSLIASYPEKFQYLSNIKYWTLSGEAISQDLMSRFRELLPHSILLNFYGMSEYTADATYYDDRYPNDHNRSPIGTPLSNTRIYILDEYKRLLPAGVTGEILISGIGMAQEYWGQSELTAARFMDNPFSNELDHQRLYESGDLGRWWPDGTLEYQGRKDQQIKIRGHRIELEEIASVIRQSPKVEEVVAAMSGGDEGQLIAYVKSKEEIKSEDIIELCRSQLPPYILPLAVIFLERFPLTPSGKVDRLRLPKPSKIRTASIIEVPKSTTEKALAALWQEQLNLEQISIADDFFSLGGDSLKGIQLVSKAKKLGIKLSVRMLFDHPTIKQLALQIDNGQER